MPDDNEKLSQFHEEHSRIFEELKRQQILGRKPSAKPRAIILCGQSGNGKSAQIPTVMHEFSDNGAVLIDKAQIRGNTQSLFDEALHGKFNIGMKDTLPNS